MACCKDCARVAGKRKRKYRSAGVGQISKTMKRGSSRSKLLIQAAKVGGGIAAGQLVKNLAKKVMGESANNSYLTGGAQILGGIVLAGMSKNTTEIGLGMAASGVADIVAEVANIAGPGSGYGSGLGLLPYSGGGSTQLPGVSGDYTYNPGSGILAVG